MVSVQTGRMPGHARLVRSSSIPLSTGSLAQRSQLHASQDEVGGVGEWEADDNQEHHHACNSGLGHRVHSGECHCDQSSSGIPPPEPCAASTHLVPRTGLGLPTASRRATRTLGPIPQAWSPPSGCPMALRPQARDVASTARCDISDAPVSLREA